MNYYTSVKQPREEVLYCSTHEFSEAVAIGRLKLGAHQRFPEVQFTTPRGLTILCCQRCYATMGGRAFAEEPRPFRFMEREWLIAQERIDRVIRRATTRALLNLEHTRTGDPR